MHSLIGTELSLARAGELRQLERRRRDHRGNPRRRHTRTPVPRSDGA
jgi:hypothetical protein